MHKKKSRKKDKNVQIKRSKIIIEKLRIYISKLHVYFLMILETNATYFVQIIMSAFIYLKVSLKFYH